MVIRWVLTSALWWSPAETEDFGVNVEASEETVRAGQPFNVTCTGPPGPGFQQQWLHPKSQAR